MGEEKLISQAEMAAILDHTVRDSEQWRLKFRDVFMGREKPGSITSSERSSTECNSQKEQSHRVLVIFIRHFFCGNCQEYLRELAAHPSLNSANLEQHNLRVTIIGCGLPSLIASYRTMTGIPDSWQVYADPSTELYRSLGMHRTLSMGTRRPQYIRRSLTGNMLRSVWQGVRRIPEGDVLGAGSWDVNGGEFLFEHAEQEDSWKISWCHKMTNSRDHTEVEDLVSIAGLKSESKSDTIPPKLTQHHRTKSSPMVLENRQPNGSTEKLDPVLQVKRQDSFRRSLSLRRQSWMGKNGGLGRVMSLRAPRQAIAA